MLWERRESWPGILITIGTVGLYDPSGTQAIWPVDRILQWYKMSDAEPIFLDTGRNLVLTTFILRILYQNIGILIKKFFIYIYFHTFVFYIQTVVYSDTQ